MIFNCAISVFWYSEQLWTTEPKKLAKESMPGTKSTARSIELNENDTMLLLSFADLKAFSSSPSSVTHKFM